MTNYTIGTAVKVCGFLGKIASPRIFLNTKYGYLVKFENDFLQLNYLGSVLYAGFGNFKFNSGNLVPLGEDLVVSNVIQADVPRKSGILRIKGKVQDFDNLVLVKKKKNSNNSHTKLKRNGDGKFIKMDSIVEFNYPHNGHSAFRIVKIINETPDYVEGIQTNENTGFKRFNKNRMTGVYKYKGYINKD